MVQLEIDAQRVPSPNARAGQQREGERLPEGLYIDASPNRQVTHLEDRRISDERLVDIRVALPG